MGKKYKQLGKDKKLEIAEWIVAHPDMMVKQVAYDYGTTVIMIYRIIEEYIDVRRVYTLKVSLDHSEQCPTTPDKK